MYRLKRFGCCKIRKLPAEKCINPRIFERTLVDLQYPRCSSYLFGGTVSWGKAKLNNFHRSISWIYRTISIIMNQHSIVWKHFWESSVPYTGRLLYTKSCRAFVVSVTFIHFYWHWHLTLIIEGSLQKKLCGLPVKRCVHCFIWSFR